MFTTTHVFWVLVALWFCCDVAAMLLFAYSLRRVANTQKSVNTWITYQCLYCKRLRGHDADCGLDMSSKEMM